MPAFSAYDQNGNTVDLPRVITRNLLIIVFGGAENGAILVSNTAEINSETLGLVIECPPLDSQDLGSFLLIAAGLL